MKIITLKKQRVEFDDKIKQIIARRAGIKFGFSVCNKTLDGIAFEENTKTPTATFLLERKNPWNLMISLKTI